MRRTIFMTLGILELAIAVVLLGLGSQLPSNGEVKRGFDQAERVTQHAGNQVHLLRRQVHELRRPELQQLATRLQVQTRTVTSTLRSQQVDFDTVRTIRDALGDVGNGLDGLANTLDPASIGKLGTGLGETAAFLEENVVPGAAQAAGRIEESTAALQKDAQRFGVLVRETPLNLQAARDMHDSLARFSAGLDKLSTALKMQRLDVMRDGFQGMEESLTTGADEVERLAGYTYPAVTITRGKPEFSQKSFWPEGGKIAEGMRKAAAGAKAANQEMTGLADDLPKLRTSIDDSRKIIDKTREALATALKQQDQLEPLLKDMPVQAARLAEELPRLGNDLARILRDTQRLKDVAAALRQAQKGIEMAVSRWPELRQTLIRSADLLKMTRTQLDQALNHRHEYESAMLQTVNLADSFAALLPLLTDQLETRLHEEELALDELGRSLDDAGAALPVYGQTAANVLWTGHLLAWLVAMLVGLHGCYLMLGASMGRRYTL
jgi:hypothetical protein